MDPNFDKEFLMCSAIKRLKRKECFETYHKGKNDIYDIELGYRHPDILHRFKGEVSKNPKDQGFYTSCGRFVTREEGLNIARDCEQVDKLIGSVLTSEDLW